jgi:DME family drug/metabolite transporter
VPTARTGLSFLVTAGVLWGTGGLLGRLLAQTAGLSAVAVATCRLLVGGALLVGYLLATGRRVPGTRAAWRRVAVTGLLAAVFQAAYFTAVSLTSVSLATLVTIGSAPVVVLIAGLRTAGRQQVAGVGLALAGLGLLVGLPGGGLGASAVAAGSAFAALAGTGFALMTLLGTRPVPGLDDVTTTGVGFTIGGLALAPAALATSGGAIVADLRTIGLLLAIGAVPTALAYTCYFRGLRTTSAGLGSVVALLEPLTATLLAVALLGERLGVAGVAGGVLLGLAVALTARGPEPVPART